MEFVFFAGVSIQSVIGGRTVRLATTLAKRGHKIHFIEMPSWRRMQLFPRQMTTQQITVHKLPPAKFPGWVFLVSNSLRKINWQNAYCIVSHPWWVPLLQKLQCSHIVYDCLDYIGIHAKNEKILNQFKHYEDFLTNQAEHIFIISPLLTDLMPKHTRNKCILLPNAVPADWLNMKPVSYPSKKTIGFHGALYEWIDYELILEVARAFPSIKVLLAGPVRRNMRSAVRSLQRQNNICLLSQQDFSMLPTLIHNFTVGIIPFLETPVAVCSDPLKLYEYLACGRPVVSTLTGHSSIPNVHAVKRSAFIQTIHSLLDNLPSPEECVSGVKDDTWEKRVACLEKCLRKDCHAI